MEGCIERILSMTFFNHSCGFISHTVQQSVCVCVCFLAPVSCCGRTARQGDGDPGGVGCFRAVLAQGALPGVFPVSEGRHDVSVTAAACS